MAPPMWQPPPGAMRIRPNTDLAADSEQRVTRRAVLLEEYPAARGIRGRGISGENLLVHPLAVVIKFFN